MNDKEQDPQLQAPQEANTTKHINFLETEEENAATANDNDGAKTPTEKAWKELREENKKGGK